ncbi:cation:proton antiporter [Ochrobactrum soli]|uniref:cation:proton antiporter n=1 Tax=Ochrobactrum soli TaxID=2448455 RepID=UPI001AECD15B|nr:cation:proton antiporter [[Ochrobactrum] soli]
MGAIVATTDPSAVIAIFRSLGAPARLNRLVEGESLLNDAAAIAIVGVLIATLGGDTADTSPAAAIRMFALSFGGGTASGYIAGRAIVLVLPLLNRLPVAAATLTLAVPYPLYIAAYQLHASGVVAVVTAGLVIGAYGPTRLSPSNWKHLDVVWGQIAVLAGAVVFLLAAVQVPDLLSLMNEADMVYLAVIVLAALVARAIVMFGIFPLLSTAGLSRPVDHRYKLAIVWGGLRGAVTLVLALALAQNEALPPSERQFVAALAAAFVLVSLFFNGLTLRWVAGRLGLTLLSPQQEALQRQAVLLSTAEVETAIGEIAADFQLPKDAVAAVQQDYRSEISQGPGTFTIEDALIEREQLSIGLVTLATREHTLIPEYGSGVISARNLDAMMRNTSLMIDAAREEGRIGYNRAARMILAPTLGYRVASFLAKHLNLRRLLARPLADRFELMICRRAVLERLVAYNNGPLRRFVGNRMGEVLEGVLRGRLKAVDEVLAQLRAHYPGHTRLLERRLLMLFALGRGAKIIEAMKAESVVSTEVALGLEASLRTRWEANISRPVPPQMEEVRISESADSDFSKSRTLVSLIRGQFSRGVFQACC